MREKRNDDCSLSCLVNILIKCVVVVGLTIGFNEWLMPLAGAAKYGGGWRVRRFLTYKPSSRVPFSNVSIHVHTYVDTAGAIHIWLTKRAQFAKGSRCASLWYENERSGKLFAWIIRNCWFWDTMILQQDLVPYIQGVPKNQKVKDTSYAETKHQLD